MHEKFELDYNGPPRTLDAEEKAFRLVALREELDEYESAQELTNEVDALVDLLVFAFGTFDRMGLDPGIYFDVVMRANMKKELAGDASKSKRGFARDLVKPEGFESPEGVIHELLDIEIEAYDQIT